MTRERYEGPIEPGMVFWGPDNEGRPYRRDLILGRHPFKRDLILYEGLPCLMRRAVGSGVGRMGVCPEINLRIVMRPEDSNAGNRPIIGRELMLIDKLTKSLSERGCLGHEVAPISAMRRGNTFLVRLMEGNKRSGRIARVTVELEGLDEEEDGPAAA